jgi:hypothetical protein
LSKEEMKKAKQRERERRRRKKAKKKEREIVKPFDEKMTDEEKIYNSLKRMLLD